MKVTKQCIQVKDLVKDFSDKKDEGVVGYSGTLNIRPPYQREFIYKPPQQIAVINSILGGMPLSCMYWGVNGDGTYEILDGQQRTMSICRFVNGDFSINYHFFADLSPEDQATILNYELDIYFCEGSTKDKIRWFEIINIAGEKLTQQELRNAIFTGPWVIDAKRYFSRSECPATIIGDSYIKGSTLRQDILELAIGWASNGEINEYMSTHRHDQDARALWDHFSEIINWVKRTFVVSRPRLMQSINWGKLYFQFGNQEFNPIDLEKRISELLVDEDVTNHKGIYEYLLTGEEKHLSLRAFPDSTKRKIYLFNPERCLCTLR